MKLFPLARLSVSPGTGEACLRKHLPSHPCDACASVCPVEAITLMPGAIQLDATRCLHCGRCLFSCPVDALEGLPAPERYLRDGALVAPLAALAPAVDELLMWHREKGVRVVEMVIDEHPGWVLAVAALNLKLADLGEPGWSIVPPATQHNVRRRWLRLPERVSLPTSVSPGRRARRRIFAEHAEFQPVIAQAACTLCGACARICTESALRFTADRLEIRPERCTGCQSCRVVCVPGAISLEPGQAVAPRYAAFYHAHCRICQQPFRAWQADATTCPLCQRHRYGMREA
ncbi:4Fe-4S binding protein [Siccibacter colletis]|uniref:4Fe-4S binding protein n=1 Tax=Siccibacter colletis TaxID=1505757 RepID=A0ABY6JCG1_9ENTR|nr:4Fe-4S binding protein [Siccibacter colletis]UYU31414.1 4Fe-4S binding protein [Siccibacter colletis]